MTVLARGRGAILVTGHHGNWEIGSILMRRVLHLPFAIVAMAEASAEVNRIRREMRDNLGVDTIEVRQSLDTALQIRRRLAANEIVAILMDRHLGRDRVQVTLLGRPAWFLRTPAVMGYLTGAPLMPCFVERSEGRPSMCSSAIRSSSRPACRAKTPSAPRPSRSPINSPPASVSIPSTGTLLPVLGCAAGLLRGSRLIDSANAYGVRLRRTVEVRLNPDRIRHTVDPFSHVAFGRTLAALHTPRARDRGTIPAVMLGALAPDVDALLMPVGWDIYLRVHEIGTHSLLGSLGIAALSALLVRLSSEAAAIATARAGGLGRRSQPSGARHPVRGAGCAWDGR